MRATTEETSPDKSSIKPDIALRKMLFQGSGKGHQLFKTKLKPTLHEGEVLVRMTLATICGSDMHTYQGRRASHIPSVLGHEGVGIVEAVGEGRDQTLIGKRVTWTLTDTCGCCKPCTVWDIPQKCESLFKYGHAPLDDGMGLNGCFSSHIMLRAGTHIVPLPDALPDSYAVPANCALSTMVAVVEPILKQKTKPQRILIQGAGLLGLYGASLLHHHGIPEILITDIVQERLDLAGKFGAKPILSRDLDNIKTHSFDAIIEVAGVSHIISDGIQHLRPGGMYIWAGMVHDRTPLDILGVDIVKGCHTVIGIHNYAARHLEEGIEFLMQTSQQFPWDCLISDPLPLEKLDEGFELTLSQKYHRVAIVS